MVSNKINSNLKFIFFIEANAKAYMTIFFVFIIIIIILFILRTFGFSESSGGYTATSEAFIFSLNNNEGLAPFVSKVKKEYSGAAIYRNSYYGPRFGSDVSIRDNADRDSKSKALLRKYYSVPPAVKDRYTVLAGTEYFSPDEVEVFYLDPSR